jgi:hypothetical protein
LPTDLVRAVVFMSWGRWVAQCPRPGCPNAEQFGRCDDGTPGGLTGTSFRCRTEYGGCGLVCAVEWPANVEDLEAVLRARPVPATRNWAPGEDPSQLLRENIEHGLIPNREVTVIGGRVTVGRELTTGGIV